MKFIKNIKSNVKRIVIKVDKQSPFPFLYKIWMSKNEILLFDQKIKNSKNYLEFGMGGSTIRALQKSKANIFSIDSSQEWINNLLEYRVMRKENGKRINLFFVDIGNIKWWGYPEDNQKMSQFPNYSSIIFDKIDKRRIDTVLIDGRFRVACTLKTIMECKGNVDLEILIHDFWDREHYHVLLKYLEVTDRSETLGSFRILKGIDMESVLNDYEKYKFIID